MSSPEKEQKSYKDTLNLPTTTLNIRANAAEREPALRSYWEAIALQEHYFSGTGTPFVLHDGPPYANGHLHVGHALNKVLKDSVVRAHRMAGNAVSFAPGWDCHGLPIELKVSGETGDLRMTDPAAFKKACRAYALRWKTVQEEEFKELGVCAEWDKRYMTMDPSYEADIMRSLAIFTEKGYIERKGKTVPWCFSCQTVLATAEIEYAERKDPSCYIMFPLTQNNLKLADNRQVSLLIWTTTPWTIPLNRAVVLHPNASYAIVALDDERAVIVGAGLVESLRPILGEGALVLATVPSSQLIGLRAHHPIVDGLTVPVIGDDGVSVTDGTACLHSAPGCGPDDYVMGIKNNLEIYSPLSADGRYTSAIEPQELLGMPITDGQWWVLKTLQERGALLHKTSIKHSYPHCWRCRNGLMFRATDQWFCNLDQHDLVRRTQESLHEITFIPSWGKTRLEAFIAHRTEWCISRQRSWGVPITALFNTVTGQHFLTPALIRGVADKVATEGIEYWDQVTIAQLRADGLLPSELATIPDEHIRKETDILDVWFDSGVSHAAVIAARGGSLPVDLYIEGSDQHRGWFQSALLSSMVLHDKAPMKTIVTHGFVMDAQGHKMSKSRGNVVDPKEVVKKYGADVLRMWVASVDYERDVVISDALLTQTAETYRKIRNTCRFLLANLSDFNPAIDCVPFEKMHLLDRYALQQALTTLKAVKQWYMEYSFASIVQLLARYCSVELSAHYLDMSKDRLYVEGATSLERRSAQTAQYYILTALNQMIAPLIPFTADDIYLAAPYTDKNSSIHLTQFLSLSVPSVGSNALWEGLHEVRSKILQEIEKLRAAGTIKHSLEAAIELQGLEESVYAPVIKELESLLGTQSLISFFNEWCIVSQCSLTAGNGEFLVITVTPAEGVKCPRCWHWFVSEREVCDRCAQVLACSV
ncbi:MAG: isoleucyl-tRNA synthetase [Candidatus Dependentiae bacterium]|nr:isoleucyl-tRNA synthetase [Candidatus Dependentiae bacterium]